jgi:uroporphyrin-III C-methyltransferase / precorrin-2 dehydrogenase / sirohydrochlorin ferrochelatase
VLPRDLARWIATARAQRIRWRRDRVPMAQRKPRLLRALNALYGADDDAATSEPPAADSLRAADASSVTSLNGPEDSWM